VREGDAVTLIAPGGQVTPAGVVPRLKQMTVVGTFDSGHFEYDSGLVMVHIDDAARIFRLEGPTGVRLKLKDLNRRARWQVNSPARSPAICWCATGRGRTAPGSPPCSWRNA
jgi:ABC-type lipoprotein release transport system permease subunit